MAEGRFAFYLVRPIPAMALWSGRLVGAMVVIQVASLLVLAPTWIAHPEEMNLVQDQRLAVSWTASSEAQWAGYFGQALLPRSWGRAGSFTGILVGVLVSLLAVHAIATFAQSRNAWLVLDLVALSTAVALTSWAVDRLISRQALGPLVWAERFFGGWLAVALLVASSVQIAHGRSDPERGRRLLSMVLWTLLLVGTLGQVIFASWITSPGVEALAASPSPPVRLSSSDSSSGEWLFLGGPTHFREGYRAAFVLEARGGRTLRLGALDVTRASLRVAADAEILIWTRCSRLTRNQDCGLWSLDLQEAELEPRPIGVPFVPAQGEMLLSPEGSLVALEHRRQWSFHEVETGRLVWTSKEEFAAVVFQPMDRVLLYRPEEGQIGILELDLSRRSEVGPAGLQPKWVGRLDGMGSNIRIQPFPKARKIFVHQIPRAFSVHDARTGDSLMLPRSFDGLSEPYFLSAGRVALISWTGQFSPEAADPWVGRQVEMILFSSDTFTERRFPLPGNGLRLGEETARGLLIGLRSAEPTEDVEAIEPGLPSWSLYELDLESGEIVPRLHGAAPLSHWNRRIGALKESLLDAGNGAVVGWSPETSRIRPIFPAIDP